jgi:hypothetical protein
MKYHLTLLMSAILLAGCATSQLLPDQPGVIAAIEDYYRDHAWENGARCVLPEMQVTHADVIDRTDGREQVEVRYYWEDERTETDLAGNTCNGFGTRVFTIAEGRVTEMTGEQRP